jgi:tRNA-dihydrouridine synthase B
MEESKNLAQRCHPLKIGSLTLANNLIMAPMAGITDLPFRTLAKEGGAGLVCTEMASATALVHGDEKTMHLMTIGDNERPVSVQLFGAKPEIMAGAAKIAQDAGADIIDINFGCPVRKIVKSGAGVKLVENQSLMVSIMESVVRSVQVPVTIKIRTGLTPDENVAPAIVKLARESGVAMVVVHGRAASDGHSGKANLAMLREAASGAQVPVIGNGGIHDELSADHFLTESRVDGLMIGRGAIGDPVIFKRIETYLNTGQILPSPSWEERIAVLKRHAALSADYYGEKRGITILRKVAAYYLKGLPNASKTRDRFNRITTLKELDELLATIWESPYFDEAASDD